MFEPKTHPLNWPIDDDKNQTLSSVTSRTLTMGEHRNLSKKHKGAELLRACVVASTGLTPTEVKRLVAPDYTSIEEQVVALLQGTAADLGLSADSDELLVPIQGDDGREIGSYKLKPPTVGTTDLMDAHNDEWERTLFISGSCSGLSASEMERLSIPDWNLLQERLIDFLQKPADFFRQKTSKS